MSVSNRKVIFCFAMPSHLHWAVMMLYCSVGCIKTNRLPDEQRLLLKLFENYDTSVRPVFNSSKNVVVNFGFTLIQIMDMVSFAIFTFIFRNVYFLLVSFLSFFFSFLQISRNVNYDVHIIQCYLILERNKSLESF